MMATKDRASCRSLQNQTAGIKAWVRTTEYHPIQQTLGIAALLCSPAEPSGTHQSDQIKKDQPQKGLHLRARGTLGQPPPIGRPDRQKNPPLRPPPPLPTRGLSTHRRHQPHHAEMMTTAPNVPPTKHRHRPPRTPAKSIDADAGPGAESRQPWAQALRSDRRAAPAATAAAQLS
jgi:hypothetical protein